MSAIPLAGSPEAWAPIPGYEGIYEASTAGRIRSVDREISQLNRWGTVTPRRLPGIILVQTVSEPSPGYFRRSVGLSKDNHCTTRLVHHLVMEAFVGPRPDGMEVAHGDGNPQHNDLSNLRYATPAQNSDDKEKHGTMLRGGAVPWSKIPADHVPRIRAMKGKIKLRELAAEYGVAESCISRIQNGVRWGHVQ